MPESVTGTPVVVEVTDRNAQFNPTRVATVAPSPTPTSTPEVAGVQTTADPVMDVVTSSFSPMLDGIRLGFATAGVATLGFLGVQYFRRRRW